MSLLYINLFENSFNGTCCVGLPLVIIHTRWLLANSILHVLARPNVILTNFLGQRCVCIAAVVSSAATLALNVNRWQSKANSSSYLSQPALKRPLRMPNTCGFYHQKFMTIQTILGARDILASDTFKSNFFTINIIFFGNVLVYHPRKKIHV